MPFKAQFGFFKRIGCKSDWFFKGSGFGFLLVLQDLCFSIGFGLFVFRILIKRLSDVKV
jgi:hypothetical protein